MLLRIIHGSPVLAAVSSLLFMVCAISVNIRSSRVWILPMSLSILFLAFSVGAIAAEGATGFWLEHTRSLWGNQIWFDLLLMCSTSWLLIIPRAKAARMKSWLWLILILCSGSVGMLAMLARLLFLEERLRVSTGSS